MSDLYNGYIGISTKEQATSLEVKVRSLTESWKKNRKDFNGCTTAIIPQQNKKNIQKPIIQNNCLVLNDLICDENIVDNVTEGQLTLVCCMYDNRNTWRTDICNHTMFSFIMNSHLKE